MNNSDYIIDSFLRLFSLIISTYGWFLFSDMIFKNNDVANLATVLLTLLIGWSVLFLITPYTILNPQHSDPLAMSLGKVFIILGWATTSIGIVDYYIATNDNEYITSSRIEVFDEELHTRLTQQRNEIIERVNSKNSKNKYIDSDEVLSDMITLRASNKVAYYTTYIKPIKHLVNIPNIKKGDDLHIVLRPLSVAYAKLLNSENVIHTPNTEAIDLELSKIDKDKITQINKDKEAYITNVREININLYVVTTLFILMFAYVLEFHIFNFILNYSSGFIAKPVKKTIHIDTHLSESGYRDLLRRGGVLNPDNKLSTLRAMLFIMRDVGDLPIDTRGLFNRSLVDALQYENPKTGLKFGSKSTIPIVKNLLLAFDVKSSTIDEDLLIDLILELGYIIPKD